MVKKEVKLNKLKKLNELNRKDGAGIMGKKNESKLYKV